IATGADSLSPEELAGALVSLTEITDAAPKEPWAKRWQAFFRGNSRRSASTSDRDNGGAQTQPGGTQPAPDATGAAWHADMAGRVPQAHTTPDGTRRPRRQGQGRGPDRRRPRHDLRCADLGGRKA